MLLNKRQLEKLKEDWWKNDDYKKKCEKPEDQSDGISIQNIGGVFIVIFVGIAMACVTLVFEYWYYKYRKNPKIIDVIEATAKHERQTNLGDGGKAMDMAGTIPTNVNGDGFTKAEKGSFFKNTMLRSRINQPFNFRPKFQI